MGPGANVEGCGKSRPGPSSRLQVAIPYQLEGPIRDRGLRKQSLLALSIIRNTRLLGCDAETVGKWLSTFRSIVVYSSSRSVQSNKTI